MHELPIDRDILAKSKWGRTGLTPSYLYQEMLLQSGVFATY